MSLQRNPSFNLKPGQSQQEFWINKISTRKWQKAKDLRVTSIDKKASTLQNFFSQSRIGLQAAQLQQHSPSTFRKNLHYDTIQSRSRSNSKEDLVAMKVVSPQRINAKASLVLNSQVTTPKVKQLPALKNTKTVARQSRNDHAQTQTQDVRK